MMLLLLFLICCHTCFADIKCSPWTSHSPLLHSNEVPSYTIPFGDMKTVLQLWNAYATNPGPDSSIHAQFLEIVFDDNALTYSLQYPTNQSPQSFEMLHFSEEEKNKEKKKSTVAHARARTQLSRHAPFLNVCLSYSFFRKCSSSPTSIRSNDWCEQRSSILFSMP